MGHRFTDDDRGKEVVTAEGTHIGTVEHVDGDTATVDRSDEESLNERMREVLGWDDDDADEVIRDDDVERTDDDRIYLRHR